MTNPLVGLRGRVTFTVLAVSAVLFAALGTIGFLIIADGGRDAIRERVEEVVDELEAAVRSGSGAVDVSTADGVDAQVVAAGTEVARRGNEIVVERPVEVGGVSVVLVGRSSQARLADSLQSLYRGLWIAVPLAAIASALMAGAATGRALRPVGDITELASTIGANATGARVPVPDTSDEIEHLAVTVNEMLDRIDEGRAAQRRFTSDAAHELRTPLMVLQAEVELAERDPGSIDADFVSRIDAQAVRLGERIDDLVLLSTLDEQRPLRLVESSLLAVARSEATALGLDAPVDGDDGVATFDVELVARAVRNLLTNARRHATNQVAVTIARESPDPTRGARVWLHVDDDGLGIDETAREQAFSRFARLDESRSTDRGGSGLGLAIVASVVEAHGGQVRVDTGPLGGARLSFWIPADRGTRAIAIGATT